MTEEDFIEPKMEFTDEQVQVANSESLAAYVVLYRTLGIGKETAIKCMVELARRKNTGDTFDFEDFIDSKVKEMPKSKNLNYDKLFMAIRHNAKSLSTIVGSIKNKIPGNQL